MNTTFLNRTFDSRAGAGHVASPSRRRLQFHFAYHLGFLSGSSLSATFTSDGGSDERFAASRNRRPGHAARPASLLRHIATAAMPGACR